MKKVTKKVGGKLVDVHTISSGDPSIITPKEKATAWIKEKHEIAGGVPDGHVRVIVLKDYRGMSGDCYEGDIIDMPERRYKSLSFRGVVKLYDGKKNPNNFR